MSRSEKLFVAMLVISLFHAFYCVFGYIRWYKKKKETKALIIKGEVNRLEAAKELDKQLLHSHLLAGSLLFLWFFMALRIAD